MIGATRQIAVVLGELAAGAGRRATPRPERHVDRRRRGDECGRRPRTGDAPRDPGDGARPSTAGTRPTPAHGRASRATTSVGGPGRDQRHEPAGRLMGGGGPEVAPGHHDRATPASCESRARNWRWAVAHRSSEVDETGGGAVLVAEQRVDRSAAAGSSPSAPPRTTTRSRSSPRAPASVPTWTPSPMVPRRAGTRSSSATNVVRNSARVTGRRRARRCRGGRGAERSRIRWVCSKAMRSSPSRRSQAGAEPGDEPLVAPGHPVGPRPGRAAGSTRARLAAR